MKDRLEIVASGFGGQGVVRLGQVLGEAAVKEGLRVTMLKSHGTETRGGYVRAQLVISSTYVDSPVVEHADIFVAFSAPAYQNFYDLCSGQILYDPEMVQAVRDDAPERHVEVPATALAQEHLGNKLFANMIMLGALTRLAEMDFEAMRKAMLEVIPRFHEQNQQALERGYNLVTPRV